MLDVHNLRLSVPYRGERFLALNGLSFSLPEAGSLGIVGESGSGKTLTALAIAGLGSAQVRREAGTIRFAGHELTEMAAEELRVLRGNEMAMVFQDSGGALNPLMRVGEQVAEGMMLFDGVAAGKAKERVAELFTEVELPLSALSKYPHQLSGGQRQRVMIAIALSRKPRLLIADEPTTALDLTTQRQLLGLLQRLHRERHMALLLISHDIAVVRQLTEQLIVLYAGEVMEAGATAIILQQPRHPYTKGLLGAIPSFERRDQPLATLRGVAEPLPTRPTQGCVFASRCPQATPACREEVKEWVAEDGVRVRCNELRVES